ARHVEIKMYQRNHTCYLKIQDDGKGIPNGVLENSNTFGLLGMKERAIIFNGHVEIASKPNQGTTVLIKIPLS
ncbi:MAG: sensor histidine kinase, partial [Phototrophicales bacterium]